MLSSRRSGQAVDSVAERQRRLGTLSSDGQRRGGAGPKGGLHERPLFREGDGQGPVERIAGADGITYLDRWMPAAGRSLPASPRGSRGLPA